MFDRKEWIVEPTVIEDWETRNIVSATLKATRKNTESEVKHQPLSDKFGQELIAALNWFYDELVKSNAANGTLKIQNMNNFHGATLEIKMTLPEK